MSGGVDRISNLPSEILERILFFAGIRQAVQLSVLSSRWKDLWKSMPDLYFDASDFPPTGGDQNWRLFRLARRVLGLRTRRVRELRVVIYENRHQSTPISASRWFNFAAQCHADEHSLSSLPYSSSSPTSRFLGECPTIIVFGMLRTLSISSIHEPLTAFEPPSDACPLLEKLSIVGCSFDCISISFSRLKELTLHDCSVFGGLRVATPSLESFDYRHGISPVCELENQPSLRHASIEIHRGNWSCDALLGLLRAIQNATWINLPSWTLEVLYKQQGSFSCLPTFHNAKHVTLVARGQRNITLIEDLLQKWPNIETLTIR